MTRFAVLAGALMMLLCACGPQSSLAQSAPGPAGFKRCVNLANALNAPEEGDWGYVIRKQDLQRIARAGFDSVRILIAWQNHAATQAPYAIDPVFFARIDEVVGQAREFGLGVILDLHDDEALYQRPRQEWQRTLAIWEQVASHYADAPPNLIFELVNEPQGKLQGALWQSFADAALARIRLSNPERWVILGGDNWNSIDGLARFEPPDDDHLMLTFHYYDPYKFTHQGASWFADAPPAGRPWGSPRERRALTLAFDRAAALARARGLPLWLGEFGATKATAMMDRTRWTGAVRRAAQSRGLGWCYFDFATEFGVYDPERESWIWPLRRTLLDDPARVLRKAPE